MPTARNLRVQIEAALADRVPAALTPALRGPRQLVACGIREIDEALQGGLPCGVITELVGPESSGRTSLALAYVAAFIREGNVCAWIDVADALCPESVAANGVDLERLLWVRCGASEQMTSRAAIVLGGSVAGSASISTQSQPRHTGGGSPHPRSEGRDMPQAIGALLATHGGMYDRQVRREKKSIGTPGAPNRPLTARPEPREEQVNSDRLPPRRGYNLAIAPRCAEPQPRRIATMPSGKPMPRTADAAKPQLSIRTNPWQALDQAMRAADLLLQGGGFSAIVLDLGSTPPEIAWRIPLATWFRYRAACERTRASLLLLTQHPCARSSAELVVRLDSGCMEAQGNVMTGIRYRAAVERSRSNESAARVVPIRKPPQSDRCGLQPGRWRSNAAWGQAR
jgi:recombination protein RecA